MNKVDTYGLLFGLALLFWLMSLCVFGWYFLNKSNLFNCILIFFLFAGKVIRGGVGQCCPEPTPCSALRLVLSPLHSPHFLGKGWLCRDEKTCKKTNLHKRHTDCSLSHFLLSFFLFNWLPQLRTQLSNKAEEFPDTGTLFSLMRTYNKHHTLYCGSWYELSIINFTRDQNLNNVSQKYRII